MNLTNYTERYGCIEMKTIKNRLKYQSNKIQTLVPLPL